MSPSETAGSMAQFNDEMDLFNEAQVEAGAPAALQAWLEVAEAQGSISLAALEAGAVVAGTAFAIEQRYNNSFGMFEPARIVSDGQGGYVVFDFLGEMRGPNNEVTTSSARATMQLRLLLEEWGDSEYHIAPRPEMWRRHPQLPSQPMALAIKPWTAERIKAHPKFQEFVAFMRGEEDDGAWEFDGEVQTVETWVDWLTDDDDDDNIPKAAAPDASSTEASKVAASATTTVADATTAAATTAAATTAAATIAAATTEPPEPEQEIRSFPEEGSYIKTVGSAAKSEPGLCFLVTKSACAVVYANLDWEAGKPNHFRWEPCPLELQPEVAGVIVTTIAGKIYPSGFLFGKSQFGAWSVFDEHRLPPPPIDERMYAKSRLPALKVGWG